VQTNAAKGLRFRTFPYILCVQACHPPDRYSLN
jgi:hypothetical protein